MKTTFSVLFFLKRDKQKLNGNIPLMCRITIDGKESRFSMKTDIDPNLWDMKPVKMTGRSARALEINSLIDNTKSVLNRIYHQEQERMQSVTAEKVKNILFLLFGKKTNFIHIYIGENFSGEMENLFDTKSDTLKLPFQESESLLNAIVKKLEVKGFSMAKVKLVNVKNKDGFVS